MTFDDGINRVENISVCERYDSSEIESFNVNSKIVIKKGVYKFVPRYSNDDGRRKDLPAIRIYKSGQIKSIDIQKSTEVKVGRYIIEAEKVIFYEDGSIKKLFPLNGKLSGFWTEDDEYKLADTYKFDFGFTKVNNKIISVSFYKNAKVKSITLWPKENIDILYKNRIIKCRTGFSMYEDGTLKSVEPLRPFIIHTPIGSIEAFDFNSIGIEGEDNSLKFYSDGRVKEIVTSTNKIIVTKSNGKTALHAPKREMLFAGSDLEDLITVKITFEGNKVIIDNAYEYDLKNNMFVIA